MKKEDIAQVAEMEKEIFSIPWSEKSFYDSLSNENTLYVVAQEGDIIAAYSGMYLSWKEGNITNVAVGKKYRRKHIASRLITFLLEEAKERGITDVTLEVRETNVPAICLYETLGFAEAGIRKNFYEKPTENALIMWKHNL